ncbi:DUF3012 domain-containing protein [Mariprofundus sp. EBB-1]|uniref:DUF3012 domain-containing protein n=1 Tax=Mariprofundus sp. EBB-1 TaxID=2650971 RepID=UPI000EF278FB|nr:DUF3012 domain-containing protein [Mariprofundus sp. EBB-1]MDQ6997568.1 DUF3012 domain-containing protein [Mariprofundus sp.]RLL50557.1 DUF3012 domain-containing protein [Mariprofundus sp. EBB-1]
MKKLLSLSFILLLLGAFSGCSAEPGTKAWCDSMGDKDKAKWTAEEGITFTKHCVVGNYKK